MSNTIKRVVMAVVFAVIASTAQAAGYPDKAIDMTVLFGGSAQTIAQVLAHLLSKQLHQSVIAVRRPGGGGAIGYTYVRGTRPDGYNIVWNSNSISTSYYQGNIPFTYKAFEPIGQVSIEVPAVAVNADTHWKTLGEMAAAAKKSGRPLKVGMSGFGSFTHITAAALFDRLGLKPIYVPYGEGRAPAELLGGRIDVAVQWPSEFLSEAKAGKLNILCVTSAARIPVLPDTPTCSEAGAKGLDMRMWRGLAAPAGTPPSVIRHLQQATKAAVDTPEFRKAGKNLGFEPAFAPAGQFGKIIATDDTELAKLMAQLGLKRQ
ncbi:MAG: Bug family tripartite tricarboxylate transporter substrate binding protein [Stellaceae bacterium]